jgi:hypothetical protein
MSQDATADDRPSRSTYSALLSTTTQSGWPALGGRPCGSSAGRPCPAHAAERARQPGACTASRSPALARPGGASIWPASIATSLRLVCYAARGKPEAHWLERPPGRTPSKYRSGRA